MLKNLVAAVVVASFTAGAAFAEPAQPAAQAPAAAKEQAVDCKAPNQTPAQKAECEKAAAENKKEEKKAN